MNPPSIISIAAFVKRYSRDKKDVPRERLLRALEWYWRDGRCVVLRENGKIKAVALGRALTDVSQASEPYYHDEGGHIVWIDEIVNRHPAGIGFLMQMAARRFGRRDVFAGHVFTREGELRMLPWRIVERLTEGDTNHVNEHTRSTRSA